MKKTLIIIAAAILSAEVASAQDMQQATDTYNNGAMALQMGDNAGALDYFKQALTMAEACGEAGADVIANCKNIIPNVELSIAKDLIKSEDYAQAVEQLNKAIASAKEYERRRPIRRFSRQILTTVPHISGSERPSALQAR